MPARRLPWFKLWPEAMRHEKIAMLSDGAFRTWVMVLAAGAEQAVRWRFASLKHTVSVTGRPSKHIRELLAARLMDEGEAGELWVHDWRQWQDRYDSDFDRPVLSEESAMTPRTLRDDSANAGRRLPPELRGEKKKKEKEKESEKDASPQPPPQAEGEAALTRRYPRGGSNSNGAGAAAEPVGSLTPEEIEAWQRPRT